MSVVPKTNVSTCGRPHAANTVAVATTKALASVTMSGTTNRIDRNSHTPSTTTITSDTAERMLISRFDRSVASAA